MRKEAEIHSEEDRKKKELIEIRNQANALIYTCERTLRDAKDKIPVDSVKDIEDKIAELKKAKDSDNIEDIRRYSDELSSAIQKVGADLYKSQQGQADGKRPEAGADDKDKPEEGQTKENKN